LGLIKKLKLLPLALAILLYGPAYGGEVQIGFGVKDVFNNTNTQGGTVNFDIYADPFWERNRVLLKLAFGVNAHVDGGLWIGAGVAGEYQLNKKWYLEGSFMPGYFNNSASGTDLFHDLEFRSRFGVAYRLTDKTNIGLTLSHTSNAGLGPRNPGLETLSIRFGRKF